VILYHGSNQIVKTIDFNKSKQFKDFGRGFYLTIYEDQAKRMAGRTVRIWGGSPVVNIFEYDEAAAKGLAIRTFAEPTAEWARFVMNNRNKYFQDIASSACNTDAKYDIVVGPVANDDMVMLFREFESGLHSFDFLAENLKFPRELTNQYSFHTPKAAQTLIFKGVLND
jgi:hypothetical protein